MDVIKRIGEHFRATFQKLAGERYIDSGILGNLFIHGAQKVLEWRRCASYAFILKGNEQNEFLPFFPHSFPAPSLQSTFLPSFTPFFLYFLYFQALSQNLQNITLYSLPNLKERELRKGRERIQDLMLTHSLPQILLLCNYLILLIYRNIKSDFQKTNF